MMEKYIEYWASLVNESEEILESLDPLTKEENQIKDEIDRKSFVFVKDIMEKEDFGEVYYNKDTESLRIYFPQDYDLTIKDAILDIIHDINEQFDADYGITTSDEDVENYVEISQGYGK